MVARNSTYLLLVSCILPDGARKVRKSHQNGVTPVLKTAIDHHQRLNLLGALLVSTQGKRIRLCVRSYWHSLTGKEVIAFLQQILKRVLGPIVLVWDRHPIHQRKMVQAFLAKHRRVHVFSFPVAAPELNPAAFIWTQVSEYTAGTAPHNAQELQTNVFNAVARTRNSQKRLQACLLGTHLKWFD
jgi:transposase